MRLEGITVSRTRYERFLTGLLLPHPKEFVMFRSVTHRGDCSTSLFTPSRCCKGWKGMASRRPGNCRASAIYKEGAELVVDARGRRRSSAASSVGRAARARGGRATGFSQGQGHCGQARGFQPGWLGAKRRRAGAWFRGEEFTMYHKFTTTFGPRAGRWLARTVIVARLMLRANLRTRAGT